MNIEQWMAALDRYDYERTHSQDPFCIGCGKHPAELAEYADAAAENMMDPNEYVRTQEGTYNPRNGHFLCTDCYCRAGMPSSPQGWFAP